MGKKYKQTSGSLLLATVDLKLLFLLFSVRDDILEKHATDRKVSLQEARVAIRVILLYYREYKVIFLPVIMVANRLAILIFVILAQPFLSLKLSPKLFVFLTIESCNSEMKQYIINSLLNGYSGKTVDLFG